MIDQLIYVLVMAIIAIPVIVFRWQIRLVRSGASSRWRATASFVAYALLPILAYVALFMALVGLEELFDRPFIAEGFSRALIPISILGAGEVLLSTLIFVIVAGFVRASGPIDHR